MKTIGNVIWFIFIGLWMAIAYCIIGFVFCITIIGIPFGKQLFKFAQLVVTPFGKEVVTDFSKHPIANIIWIIFGGLESCLAFLIVGLVFYITIIGIPLGKQAFKFAQLALAPFGAEVK